MYTPNLSSSCLYLSQIHASIQQDKNVPWQGYTARLLVILCDRELMSWHLEYSHAVFLGHTWPWKKPTTHVFMLYTFSLYFGRETGTYLWFQTLIYTTPQEAWIEGVLSSLAWEKFQDHSWGANVHLRLCRIPDKSFFKFCLACNLMEGPFSDSSELSYTSTSSRTNNSCQHKGLWNGSEIKTGKSSTFWWISVVPPPHP